MKKCKVCGELKLEEDFYDGRSDCKSCQKKYIMGWQEAHRARVRIHKRRYAHTPRGKRALVKASLKHARVQFEHYKARQRANYYKDQIMKDCCERCGSTIRLHMHHPDYDQPLQTETLCRLCHRDLHEELRWVENLLKNGRKIRVTDYLQFYLV